MRHLVYLRDVVTLKLDEEKCMGCGTCLLVCPHAVLERANGKVEITDRDACMECGACFRNCPVNAISVRAGVGCATAVINSVLGRNSASCCCTIDREGTSSDATEHPSRANPGTCC